MHHSLYYVVGLRLVLNWNDQQRQQEAKIHLRNLIKLLLVLLSLNSGQRFSLALVIQKVDCTIHWINLYPLDNTIDLPNARL